ncbi:hypothetical protein IKF81_03105 [Candidatus Saccharibacteria bacterium]|nr:hypothetical protein [Candidatus Saccharibacteria bacterium]
MINVEKISGIGEFEKKVVKNDESNKNVVQFFVGERAFLIENPHTIEVRTDEKLKKVLVEKYESVMESRYFGRGGIEIVVEGKQLDYSEIEDLVRLSYNLTKEKE